MVSTIAILVAGVRRDHEVAPAAVEAAVVQEALGLDAGHLQVLDVRVVDEQDLPVSLTLTTNSGL